jgi:DNA repair protein RadD
MSELRSYQQEGVAAIRGAYAAGRKAVLYAAPTGSGKTRLFATIVAGAAARGNSICILGHRVEITDQISAALDDLGVPHGIIAAGTPVTDMPVQVASVATLARRLHRIRPPGLLVIDEAHHSVAGTWLRIIEAFPEAHILGVTATPERLDGKGLGDIFEKLVLGPSVEELVSAGVVIDAAVDEYQRRCDGAPAIVFGVDIEHSQRVAARFSARGYRAAHVDGDTPKAERRRLIAALGSTEVQVVTNCGLISEGLDVPTVTAAILLRPTKSLALYLQQVGRALRPAPGKRALVLDHAGNVFRHGFPDDPRDWSLDGRGRKGSGEAPIRRCPHCGALNALATWICSECGAVLREEKSHIEITPEPLIEIDRLAGMTYRGVLRWAGADERRLRAVARARGYKRGWVFHRLREIAEDGP